MDNHLISAKQVEVQVRFGAAAARALGISVLEIAQNADNEPNLQMLIEAKAVAFAKRYHESKADIEAQRAFSQERADALRAAGHDNVAQAEDGTTGSWYSGGDVMNIKV